MMQCGWHRICHLAGPMAMRHDTKANAFVSTLQCKPPWMQRYHEGKKSQYNYPEMVFLFEGFHFFIFCYFCPFCFFLAANGFMHSYNGGALRLCQAIWLFSLSLLAAILFVELGWLIVGLVWVSQHYTSCKGTTPMRAIIGEFQGCKLWSLYYFLIQTYIIWINKIPSTHSAQKSSSYLYELPIIWFLFRKSPAKWCLFCLLKNLLE